MKKELQNGTEHIDPKERSRGWLLTIHKANYTSEICYDNLEKYVRKNLSPNYFCFDEEQNGEKGSLHMHLYFEMKDAITSTRVSELFPCAHYDKREGTPTDCRNYVFKLGEKNKEKALTVKQPALEFGDFTKLAAIRPYKKGGKEQKIPMNDKVNYMLENFETLEDMAEYDSMTYNTMRPTIELRFAQKKLETFKESCTKIQSKSGKLISS